MNPSHPNPPSDQPDPTRLEYARPSAQGGSSTRRIVLTAFFWLFLIGVAAMVILPALNSPRPRGNRIKSASNLKQIGLAIQMYANDHNHQFPDLLSTLVANEYLGGPEVFDVFINPGGGDTRAVGPTTQAAIADFARPGHCSYLYFGAGLLNSGDPATITACEAPGTQKWTGMNILFLDGHVEVVDAPTAATLRAALAKGPVAWTSAGGIIRPATQPTTHPTLN